MNLSSLNVLMDFRVWYCVVGVGPTFLGSLLWGYVMQCRQDAKRLWEYSEECVALRDEV